MDMRNLFNRAYHIKNHKIEWNYMFLIVYYGWVSFILSQVYLGVDIVIDVLC